MWRRRGRIRREGGGTVAVGVTEARAAARGERTSRRPTSTHRPGPTVGKYSDYDDVVRERDELRSRRNATEAEKAIDQALEGSSRRRYVAT
ncbi:hypothetical protein GS928_25550 [Rhodococcus hoagii]|nr:hypothetical protein [Prescottella equi]